MLNNELPEDMTRKYVGELIDRRFDVLLAVLEEAIDECSRADHDDRLKVIAEHCQRAAKLSEEIISEY